MKLVKKFCYPFVVAVASIILCLGLVAFGKKVDYSIAGKTFEFEKCEIILKDDVPDGMASAMQSASRAVNTMLKGNYSLTFDDIGKCKIINFGQSCELDYEQIEKTVKIAGGNGADGMVVVLNEAENALSMEISFDEQPDAIKQAMSAFGQYINNFKYTFNLKA